MSGTTEELAGSWGYVHGAPDSRSLLLYQSRPLFPFALKTAARLGGSELEQNRGKKMSWEATYF